MEDAAGICSRNHPITKKVMFLRNRADHVSENLRSLQHRDNQRVIVTINTSTTWWVSCVRNDTVHVYRANTVVWKMQVVWLSIGHWPTGGTTFSNSHRGLANKCQASSPYPVKYHTYHICHLTTRVRSDRPCRVGALVSGSRLVRPHACP